MSTIQPHAPADPIAPDQRYLNRDLSWLEFNRRVLAQATDPRTPLLARVKFLGIFASNLDEFFMKRVGYIKKQLAAGATAPTPDGLTPGPLLFAVRSMVHELIAEQSRCYESDILPALAEHGVRLLRYADLNDEQRADIDRWFHLNVFPVLTPLAVDPGHRFPFISNLSENIGVMVSRPGGSAGWGGESGDRHFARVKIPDVLPRLIPVRSRDRDGATKGFTATYISLEEVIRNNLDDLFPGMTIHDVMAFRVTRNAAVEIEEDREDVLQSVENELRMRRFAHAVRIEVAPNPPRAVLNFVVQALRLTPEDVYERGGPLEYADLFPIAELDLPHLKEAKWNPVVPPRLSPELIENDADIFAAIRERDILLHHPYESFQASVERFIAAAAKDPDVLAIKQTIYRTSPDSPFISSLVRAAEDGKQVAVLVELRARFDESKNVRFARMLEKAGVHVAYGVVGLKTHCKTSLVVRREAGGLRSYAHVGTGNYNPSTAQLYTDLGLLTCDRAITDDVVNLFNFLTGRSLKREYDQLMVAPFSMRDGFSKLIDREIELAKAGKGVGAGGGRIIAKMNSLEDKKITEKLYEASQAGVKITLIVRGFCCLRPGVPGLSENINVISIVGRFLEHSRLFYFGNGAKDPADGTWYISSADWMYRNLSTRVEAAVPVKDREARQRLQRLVDIMLADRRAAWDLNPDGSYTRRAADPKAAADSVEALGTFQTLMREALGKGNA
ncbi:MAG: polyphosphate kinase 1 [Phycisphaeraceae bacterium]|nr:polyphosphate kinase 1 [Phycisphaeraceae bacterium]